MNARNTGTSRTSTKPGVASTIGYVRAFVGPSLRPNGKMPLSAHEEAGRLLKEVSAAAVCRKAVYSRLSRARDTLDEWAMQEYPDHNAPTNDVFFNLYYHLPERTAQRHISQPDIYKHVTSLQAVKEILAKHYPDSKPLREVMKQLDGAIKSLEC